MAKFNSYYKIPTGIDEEVCDVILKKYKNIELENSTIGGNKTKDFSWRKSKNFWIHTDHWISGMMAHFIHYANNNYFNYDLSSWGSKIQYSVYDSVGSHYDWHTDTHHSEFNPTHVRKLSISLLLSSKKDYEGGDLQIMNNPREIVDINLDIGDAIIFSSDTIHKVNPIISGKRVALVGWFAGPSFK